MTADSHEHALRAALVAAARDLDARGLTRGSSGNLSARLRRDGVEGMLITPTGLGAATLAEADLAFLALDAPEDADGPVYDGPLAPSSEWRIHRNLLRARPEFGAVVHTHSTYATVLAMARRPITAGHYAVAAFGGPDVRCAPYATFGTPELSAHALAALEGRTACLLANHGAVACGRDLPAALWAAAELEALAQAQHAALAIGGPVLLDDAEMARVAALFRGYGPRRADDPTRAGPAG